MSDALALHEVFSTPTYRSDYARAKAPAHLKRVLITK